MKLQFSMKEYFIIGTVILIVVFGIFFTQFFYLGPLKLEVKQKQELLKSEQKISHTIEKRTKANPAGENVNVSELLKSIPVKPLQDQFIIDIEKAETISNSQIQSMSFSDGSDSQENSTGNNELQQNSLPANQNKPTSTSSTMPKDLKKLTVQLMMKSPGYEEFEKFVTALEEQKRMAIVESIDYSDDGEQRLNEEPDKEFTYKLTISSFYMPGLTDLLNKQPKIDVPNPADKENPLAQYPDITGP